MEKPTIVALSALLTVVLISTVGAEEKPLAPCPHHSYSSEIATLDFEQGSLPNPETLAGLWIATGLVGAGKGRYACGGLKGPDNVPLWAVHFERPTPANVIAKTRLGQTKEQSSAVSFDEEAAEFHYVGAWKNPFTMRCRVQRESPSFITCLDYAATDLTLPVAGVEFRRID